MVELSIVYFLVNFERMNLSPKTLAPPNTRSIKRRSRLPCKASQIFVATKANRATLSKINNRTLGIMFIVANMWFF